MSQEQTTLEIIAPTVDEAIANGIGQLGLPREAVDVEILDAGSKGLFGLGGRQARVRIKIKPFDEQAEVVAEQPSSASVGTTTERASAAVRKDSQPEESDKALKVASTVVRDLLERMHVRAKVSAQFVEPSATNEQRMILVEITGEDLSILIGRRSETLNALQYITSLIVGKELGAWTPLMLDVQGFRSRRERQLKQLAHRMAEQAVTTGRRQVLEPMPSNERRVVHLELRDHPKVITESVGEEPNRKVTISLKK